MFARSASSAHRSAVCAALTSAVFALCPACGGGGGGGSTGTVVIGGNFNVANTDPPSGATIYLNDPIAFDFTKPLDLGSASLTTVAFDVLDPQGNPLPETVSGSFALGTRPGDSSPGRRLVFVPRFPTNNDYSDGGFRAGRAYVVRLAGAASGAPTLLSSDGLPLALPASFVFATPIGTQASQLFRNPVPGGPHRTGVDITTANGDVEVPLGLFGAPPLEVRLSFDQPLNPNDGNVPVHLDTNPLVVNIADRGNIYLEYDDPVYGANTWITAGVELERNDPTGATVVLRPVGVLPNNAEVRVIVERTLEDIAGESNVADPSYDRAFAVFKTTSDYGQQWNGIVEEFASTAAIDLAAVFGEAPAEVGPGYVRAGFAFEGTPTALDYQPAGPEVVLNTAFTQITPVNGLPFNVAGGLFRFRNVTIPQGVSVVGQGPNAMVWLCTGGFTVAGTLSVRGGDGTRVDTLQSANVAKPGGFGACGGGNGGAGTPSATMRDLRGGTGSGPLQAPGRGGRGGYLACTSGCYTGSGYNGSGGGSGGGGGTMATQGDRNWRGTIPTTIVPNIAPTANTAFQQLLGYGGSGCSGGSGSRTSFLVGGEPGELVFTDARADNDFWGNAVDVNRNLRITGELVVPIGGGGGGGGGDTSPAFTCSVNGSNPANDYSGGGGGGGGGVLIVKALDTITVTSTGKIVADGGNGGGGEQVGACGEAGGGGGGAGGMVVLMSAKSIVIEAHGVAATNRYVYGSPSASATPTNPFLGNDYNFAISADGGVCRTGGFGAVNITGKYPASGQTMVGGITYDVEPLGGLGGMGIVQLMAPPGDNANDGTNTRLDDNIHFRLPGQLVNLTGAAKRQLLAWRGFPNALGVAVDDFGVPTNIGSNEGDIRPAPVLLPVPFQAKSRVRSKWIDTGASRRRPLPAPDDLPRGIVTAGGAMVGPGFEFAGLDVQPGANQGYLAYVTVGPTARPDQPIVMPPAALQLIDPAATYLGAPAVGLRLAAPNAALATSDRFVQYDAELLDSAGAVLAGFRILSHDQQELLVDPSSATVPVGAIAVQVRAKFYSVYTDGVAGLGPTYTGVGGGSVPVANVRIGFAFHNNPTNQLVGRYPATSLQDFVHDLNDPGLQAWIAANGAPRYVQWDVVFDMQYQPGASVAPSLGPTTPRPALDFLRLPFRF